FTGANDTAAITGTNTGALIEDHPTTVASGTLTVTDVDGKVIFSTNENYFAAVLPTALNGSYGVFTFNENTGAWTYTLDTANPAVQALALGQQITDTLMVSSLDGTASETITITITGTNDAPAITVQS